MTKFKMLEKMYEKANALQKNYTWQGWEEIWDMCYDWNSTHDRKDEICMSEHWNDETDEIDGFYIEDDYWIFEEGGRTDGI